MKFRQIFVIAPLLGLAVLGQTYATGASSISPHHASLAGVWQAKIDEADQGLAEQWFTKPLTGANEARLPGSLAESGLGHRFDLATGRYEGLNPPYLKWPSAGYTDAHRRDELGVLVAERMSYGPAWFERIIEIPESWRGRQVRFSLERVKWASNLWLDGRPVAGQGTRSLHTPHVYNLGQVKPGTHRLTLRIDNRPQVHMGIAGHGYGMETEPLWLGAVGDLQLQLLDPQRIERISVLPAPDHRSVRLNLQLASDAPMPANAKLTATVLDPADGRELGKVSHPLTANDATKPLSLIVQFTETAQAWDEFNPKLYKLHWVITADANTLHTGQRRVGFRAFERDGRRIVLNGKPVFLRGNLDCAIHPESHTPPTHRDWWEHVLQIHKNAGFNHIRFHTWCPPEIAFEVADELGLYLQIETAFWVDDWIHRTHPLPHAIGQNAEIDAWVEEESLRIIRHYELHPSFVMFCIGNEFGNQHTDWDRMQELVARLNKATDHALVSGTTARKSMIADEYWVTHNSGKGTRGIGPRHTNWDFTPAVEATEKPLISHETGQRPSWPDYDMLLPKFKGVMQPWNLKRLKASAEAAGCRDHLRRAEASARFALLQYKNEHEGMRRTPGLAGYQLLMLHDFTGQGEAHVGLLDAFFDEKPGITLEAIRAWNGPTVPLARFNRYTWTTDQTFEARLELAHEGPAPLQDVAPQWQLVTLNHDQPAKVIAQGSLPVRDIPDRAISDLGTVRASLTGLQQAAALRLSVRVGEFENHWNLWAYPPASAAPDRATGLHLTGRFDKMAQEKLEQGETVVLLGHDSHLPTARKIKWATTYWTGAWGWGNGMGLIIDPNHPALQGFPTAAHSDWQWQDLIEGGQAIQLRADLAESMDRGNGIVVESLADFHVPAREACVFVAKVGQGKLLVCSLDLSTNLKNRPAARALRQSLLDWAASDTFAPNNELSPQEARELLVAPDRQHR